MRLIVLYVCATVAGCTLPSTRPYNTVRTCTPPHTMEVSGTVQGQPNQYRQTLDERCVDGVSDTSTITHEVRTPHESVRETETVQQNTAGIVRAFERTYENGRGYGTHREYETPHSSFGFSLQVNPDPPRRRFFWR